MPNISKLFKPVFYADDINIIFSSDTISDLSELMNSELKKLSSWLAIKNLTLNIDKCIYILQIIGKVTEYGQCPNTDTLGISETKNSIKKLLMNNIFIIIKIF